MEAQDARRNRVELLATLLLAVAAVATAWSTYQGAAGGEQVAETAKATAARIESSEAATRRAS